MSTQEMQNSKLQLIQWIAEIEDNALIDELLEIQIKNKDIPQWQKEEVDRISKAIDEGTISTRPWDEAKREIFKKE